MGIWVVGLLGAILADRQEPEVDLADLEHFGVSLVICQQRARAKRRRDYLEARVNGLGGFEAEQLWPALRDAKERSEAWELLDYASDVTLMDWQRLEALAELRRSIGYPAYYRGEMPFPIGLEFLQID